MSIVPNGALSCHHLLVVYDVSKFRILDHSITEPGGGRAELVNYLLMTAERMERHHASAMLYGEMHIVRHIHYIVQHGRL